MFPKLKFYFIYAEYIANILIVVASRGMGWDMTSLRGRILLLCIFLCLIYWALDFFTVRPVFLDKLFPSKDQALRIITYNTHFGTNMQGKSNLRAVASFLDQAEGDIICLQEVDLYSFRSYMTNQPKFFQDYLSMETAYGNIRTVLAGQTGNMILSRYPIISVENKELPSSEQPRRALKAVIQTPTGPITVINTHLGLSKEIRQKQISVLQQWIAEDENPVILGGDFNTSRRQELLPIRGLLADAGEVADSTHIHTLQSAKYQSRIDYIFLSKEFIVSEYKVSPFAASDHYPVIVDILWNR